MFARINMFYSVNVMWSSGEYTCFIYVVDYHHFKDMDCINLKWILLVMYNQRLLFLKQVGIFKEKIYRSFSH